MNKRKYLTESEVEAMLHAVEADWDAARNYCLIYVMFIHGLRATEAGRLRISDIDVGGGRIYIHRLKNGFSTIHPLFEKEIKILNAWLRERKNFPEAASDWLFLSKKGNPLSRQRIYALIKHYGGRAGISIPTHPHMLRHACGFSLADRGIDTRLIQDYLGHRNIRHTVRYTASNAQRFEGIWLHQKKIRQKGPNCCQFTHVFKNSKLR
ncbi:tyrosine-type DNA invertase [Serratia bockelmannii]|uniref:tyrosine-type DNA invertase n=1 Tax=Serratia bockelmannii TaxID=2703793 RepID=UPI003FA77DF4